MSVAGRTRRGPTVTSYHVELSDRQEFTVIADALNEDLQPRGAPPPRACKTSPVPRVGCSGSSSTGS